MKFIFGLKLNQMRESAGFSLKELSDKAGISPSYINEIEKGKKYPKADKIVALATALEVSYDELVSLKLRDELDSLSDILKNGVLQEIPFELFGLETSDIMEIMQNAPMKFSALIDTFIKIARNYDMRVEHLLFAAMRSYQEMHNNYFPDIEDAAERFMSDKSEFKYKTVSYSALTTFLKDKCNYEILEEKFTHEQGLAGVRSFFIPGKKPKIILNDSLLESQKNFILAKEIGYKVLKLNHGEQSAALMQSPSFDVLLNNFKSSYFAGALLIKRRSFVDELRLFFKNDVWNGDAFLDIMQRFGATPEMFYHRLTQILPEFFNIDQLYFLRFHHNLKNDTYNLTKELHFSRLHQPHGIGLNEHYCRRWITLILLKELKKKANNTSIKEPIVGVQKSRFYQTENEYFCTSIARPLRLTKNTNSCVTLGFVLTDTFKRKVRFWNDPSIESLIVNKTCERCAIQDCKERVAEPVIYQIELNVKRGQESLEKLLEKYSE